MTLRSLPAVALAIVLTALLVSVPPALAKPAEPPAPGSSRADIAATAGGLALSEAIDMIEHSALEQIRWFSEIHLVTEELRAGFGEDWSSNAEARATNEDMMVSVSQRVAEQHRSIQVASHRVLVDGDDSEIKHAFQRLSDLGLATLLGSPYAIVTSDPAGQRLKELVQHSAMLQDRLDAMLGNDGSYMALAFAPDQLDAMLQAGDLTAEEIEDFTIGQFSSFSVLRLLPQAMTEAMLADIIAGNAHPHLQRPLRHSIINGHVNMITELSPEWIAAQVAAGHGIWLALPSPADDPSGRHDLSTQLAKLPRTEQLPVIASARDAALYPLLHQLHSEIILELECSDCQKQPGMTELEHLLQAAISMPGVDTDDLTWALLNALPPRQKSRLADFAFLTIKNAPLPERRVLSSSLLDTFPDLDLHLWQLGLWPGEDALLLEGAVSHRLENWQREVGINSFEGHQQWQGCDALGMLLFSHRHGWYQDWDRLIDELSERGLTSKAMSACHMELSRLPKLTADLETLHHLIDFFEVGHAGPEQFRALVMNARYVDQEHADSYRQVILNRVQANGVLDAMPEDQQIWLLNGRSISSGPKTPLE